MMIEEATAAHRRERALVLTTGGSHLETPAAPAGTSAAKKPFFHFLLNL